MNLLPFFEWCENSGLGAGIRGSVWLFPIIEAFHLVALAAIGGAVLLVDLRMLGLIMKRQPVSELARDAYPWLVRSLIVMLASGILLFMSEAVKSYYSTAFRFKMLFLVLAMIFTFTVRRSVTMKDAAAAVPNSTYKWVALVSMLLWLGVGAGGRWIGFS